LSGHFHFKHRFRDDTKKLIYILSCVLHKTRQNEGAAKIYWNSYNE
jgi:hypothetical protein